MMPISKHTATKQPISMSSITASLVIPQHRPDYVGHRDDKALQVFFDISIHFYNTNSNDPPDKQGPQYEGVALPDLTALLPLLNDLDHDVARVQRGLGILREFAVFAQDEVRVQL